jgi:hypothetical protein
MAVVIIWQNSFKHRKGVIQQPCTKFRCYNRKIEKLINKKKNYTYSTQSTFMVLSNEKQGTMPCFSLLISVGVVCLSV